MTTPATSRQATKNRTSAKETATRSRPTALLLGMIFLLALFLRFWGLMFGMPFNYHFDEHIHMVLAYNLSIESPIFTNFGFLQALVIGAHWLFEQAQPLLRFLWADHPRIEATALSPNMSYHLVARWINALAGSVTVIPVFFLGRRLWNRHVGLAAATFMAVAYIHVRTSHFGIQNALATLFAVTAALFASGLQPGGRWRNYLWAGLFSGLAIGTKPIVWPAASLILLFHLFGNDQEPTRKRLKALLDPRLLASYLTVLLTSLLCLPQLTLDTKDTIAFWKMTSSAGRGGGFDRFALDPGGPLTVYGSALAWGLGWVCLGLFFVGVALALIQSPRNRRPLLLLAFPALFFAFLIRPNLFYFTRYAIPATPFILLFGAAALWSITERITKQRRTILFVLLSFTAALQPALSAFRFDYLLTQTDTRTLAKQWIEENIPEGTFVAREGARFSPQLATESRPTFAAKRTYKVAVKDLYGLSELADSMGAYRGNAKVIQYRNAGVEYLIVNSINRGMRLLDPEQDAAKKAFYSELEATGHLVAEFSPYAHGAEVKAFRLTDFYAISTKLWRHERAGPIVSIYRLDP